MPITVDVLQAVLPTDHDYGCDFAAKVRSHDLHWPNGRCQTIVLTSGRLGEGAVSWTKRTQAYYKSIRDLWNVCKQEGKACLFWDHKDNTMDEEPIGIGDGAETEFQLRVRSQGGGSSVYYDVRHPVNGDLTVTVNGILLSDTIEVFLDDVELASSEWTLDNETGQLVFDAAPGPGVVITVSGRFVKAIMMVDPKFPGRRTGRLFHVEGMRIKEINA